MNDYTEADVLLLAKRWQNSKRSYLLVNPLQAKHCPSDPGQALAMMRSLGRQVAEHYPQARLVIGFAETATAIGATLASCLGPDCWYIQTTRENVLGGQNWVDFQEEHSHAVEQKLCGDRLAEAIEHSPQLVFVDDEFSTGQTLLNMVNQLRLQYTAAENREIVAASIINRLQPSNEQVWTAAGIKSEYLVRPNPLDYERLVADIPVVAAAELPADPVGTNFRQINLPSPCLNPRLGVQIADYQQCCQKNAAYLTDTLVEQLKPGAQLLVLGTEECMYPALLTADCLACSGHFASVRCHATTRSPIGVYTAATYPVRNGNLLHSFYDQNRRTYIYNLAQYDAAVVFSDTENTPAARLAQADLAHALNAWGCTQLFYVGGGQNV